MRFRVGDRVLVGAMRPGTWGAWVFDPNESAQTDIRPYDLERDGASGLVTVTVCGPTARAMLSSVRGAVGIPHAQILEGRTDSGSACWFRSVDILAVVP